MCESAPRWVLRLGGGASCNSQVGARRARPISNFDEFNGKRRAGTRPRPCSRPRLLVVFTRRTPKSRNCCSAAGRTSTAHAGTKGERPRAKARSRSPFSSSPPLRWTLAPRCLTPPSHHAMQDKGSRCEMGRVAWSHGYILHPKNETAGRDGINDHLATPSGNPGSAVPVRINLLIANDCGILFTEIQRWMSRIDPTHLDLGHGVQFDGDDPHGRSGGILDACRRR